MVLEVSFYISTTWWVSLLMDQWVPEGTCSQDLRRLRLIGSVLRTSKCSVFNLIEIVILWVRYSVTQLVRFARCCTSVFDFHSKNRQITSKLLTKGYRYHKLRKTFGKFFRSYSELLSKFGAISFQEYVSKGITHPVFYGDLVYKQRRVKSDSNFISSGSKIVKRLRRRQYDPEIIERTIGLVLGPFTALYRSFLKRCTLTNKAVGTICGPCLNLLKGDRVLIPVPSDCKSGLLQPLDLNSRTDCA